MNILELILGKQKKRQSAENTVVSERTNEMNNLKMNDTSERTVNIHTSGAEETKRPNSLLQLRKMVLGAEDLLLGEALLECHRIFASEEPSDDDLTDFSEALYKTSPRICGAVGYELAKMNYSRGTSVFHHGGSRKILEVIPMPFSFFSWAGFEKRGGIAFQICRDCFQSDIPHLYFEADSTPYCLEDEVDFENTPDKIAKSIMEYSYGIDNVKVTIENENHYAYRCRIEFDLSPQNNQWGSLQLQNTSLHFSFLQEPVIQIPIVGEFFCTFGEMTPNGDVPLHKDDFCMK